MNAAAEPPSIIAVLDTNLLLDIHSCHDLVGTFNARHAEKGEAVFDDPLVTYRLARARESVLLAIYLKQLDHL